MSKKREGQLEVPTSSGFLKSSAWYLRERTPVASCKDRRTRKYFALEEVENEDGFKGEVLVEKDYPYTPEYVSSFAASSDYRADPVGAVNKAPKRTNLGDITNLQRALGLDFETARHLYAEFRAAAERSVAQKEAAVAAGDAAGAAGDGVGDKKEV